MTADPVAMAAAPPPMAAPERPRFGLRGALLLLLVIALAGPVVVVNVSDYFAQEQTPAGARQALAWNEGNPAARTALALEAVPGESGAATLARLRAAAAVQPTEGRLYAALALHAEAQGAPALAQGAMQAAATLAPQRTDVSLAALSFWLRHDDVMRALQAGSVALTRSPELAPKLYPVFLQLMASPQSDAAFRAVLANPLPWWPGFFSYVAQRAPNAEVLRVLHSLQIAGPNAFEEPQLRVYLERLFHDGNWLEAYFVWLDSLPPASAGFSSELYNGGFEEPTRNLGFEWTDQPLKGVLVGFDPTYGTTGSRALHVVFQGLPARWRHFNQYLMLAPGDYHLRGRVRVDSLQAERGVQWNIRCIGDNEPLAVTDRFKGTEPWRHFSVSFTVPARGCASQDLRLSLVGNAQLDFVANGQIWFDDLAVVRQ